MDASEPFAKFVLVKPMFTDVYQEQNNFFRSGKSRDTAFRIASLKILRDVIATHERKILAAIFADLHKEETDAYATEIAGVYHEIKFAIRHLRDWVAPQKVATPFFMTPAKSFIYKEPYGVTLIVAPWNYPFQLLLLPLVGAIAAGNTAILKPSELSEHTASVMEEIINQAFPRGYIHVVCGAARETQALLELPVDYIFFTGSVPVGKVVMAAAAKHLTPLTLELGGKSPAIVHESANLRTAASRISWGKFLNAGQTCIAPDYVLVHESVKDAFIDEMVKVVIKFYGEDASRHPRYCRIINDRHFQRLVALIDRTKIVYGGKTDADDRYIEPTLLYPADWNDEVMQGEIFGPILPIIPYSDLDEVIRRINDRPHPLSLYMFVNNRAIRQKIIRETFFGGGAVNNTIMQVVSPYLPFGGLGYSGLGRYHGRFSFETFSHTKSILRSCNFADPVDSAAPHKGGLMKIFLRLMK